MELEWVLLGYAASAEAIMLFVAYIAQRVKPFEKGIDFCHWQSLKTMLCLVSFCLFLLLDIVWKYGTLIACERENCSQREHLSHYKSIMKSQWNAIMIAVSLLLYFFLFSATTIRQRLDFFTQQLKNLQRSSQLRQLSKKSNFSCSRMVNCEIFFILLPFHNKVI